MKFALVNSHRAEAEVRKKGICICCGSEVRAYCGKQRVNHWKHTSLIECDSWNEGETDWHREWKNNFDVSQQEFIKYDKITGEKHIADIYIPSKDLVIEFQHSPIHIDEILSREKFYKKIIWVVDLKEYVKNISLHKDIKDVFDELVEYPWAINQDKKCRKLRKEGKLEEAENLRIDNSGWDYFNAFEKKYYSHSVKENYFLMIWKYQHKRWEEASMPMFFDLNDGYIYLCIESVKNTNAFIVKRFKKEKFVQHYKI